MNIGAIGKVLGKFLQGFSLVFIPSIILASYDEWLTKTGHFISIGFLGAAFICWFIGFTLKRQFSSSSESIYRKEAIALVPLIWVSACIIGAIPYLLCHTLTSPVDALFESTSGFTTTGATIFEAKRYDPQNQYEIPYFRHSGLLSTCIQPFYGTLRPLKDAQGNLIAQGFDAVPRAVLLWRNLTQWLGGGGIVVLFVTLLPLTGIGGRVLFQAEVTGPSKEGLTPRIKETAQIIWIIYGCLSIAQLLAHQIFTPELSWFDRIMLMFSTVSTGGYCSYGDGIAHFKNPALEWILIAFMSASSINFYLFFHLWRRKFYKLADVELMIFASLIVIGGLCCSILLAHSSLDGSYTSLLPIPTTESLRSSFFQITSCVSSTGYATPQIGQWPAIIQLFLFLTMVVGGMSGSTAGGLKMIRFYIVFRYCLYCLRALHRPQSSEVFRIHGHEMSPSSVLMVFSFFSMAALSAIIFIFFLVTDGHDLQTAGGLALCFLNNTGLSPDFTHANESFAFLSPLSKLAGMFMMILGRLEYFALLVVLLPSFWKKH